MLALGPDVPVWLYLFVGAGGALVTILVGCVALALLGWLGERIAKHNQRAQARAQAHLADAWAEALLRGDTKAAKQAKERLFTHRLTSNLSAQSQRHRAMEQIRQLAEERQAA